MESNNRVVLGAVPHFEEAQRSQCQGRRGVPALRLDDDAKGGYAYLPKLVDCEEAVGLVADDEGLLDGGHSVEAAHGLLEHAIVVDDGEELLGVALAGQRPEPRPGAAGHYHGVQGHAMPPISIQPVHDCSAASLAWAGTLTGHAEPRWRS